MLNKVYPEGETRKQERKGRYKMDRYSKVPLSIYYHAHYSKLINESQCHTNEYIYV